MDSIRRLRTWAPIVLSQAEHACHADLMEIIRLRVLMDTLVPDALDRDNTEPFLALIKADQACVPHCGTLLFLNEAEARLAAEGSLNRWNWSGVHLWDVTTVLPRWAESIREGVLGRVHRAEVFISYSAIRRDRGEAHVQAHFRMGDGSFRLDLGAVAREALCEAAQRHRIHGWAEDTSSLQVADTIVQGKESSWYFAAMIPYPSRYMEG
jgi:hypothetical protein